MQVKEYGLSIVLNAFLAYLWLIFINHSVNLVNSMNNSSIMGAFMIGIGTALFFEIVQRVTPFNKYKLSHPINITGVASFVLVVVVNYLGFNLV
ncbi:hypothetical protein [Alkalihalobacterium chitinilyticum]|uniref:Uncharacterized protein n=1 Tax=Alkalihalobacterium chitinilyticum TaxID=2980103 RepID=A0ABT5VFI9_9BACI|nr:hypothetical protein [Alkalihalobacterium chitinilyticum]MDE5414217.1 hypothetical protein [Alkalihalobacterium chitinilyticum]